MDVTIKIPDQLAAEARAHGREPRDYAEEILAQQFAPRSSSIHRLRTAEEIRAWLDELAQFSDKIPPLPDVISR